MSDNILGKVYQLDIEHDERNDLWPQDRIARLVAILDSQPDSVAIINKDYKVVDMNPSGLFMIGAGSINDILGKNIIEVVGDIYHEVFTDAFTATFRGETTDIEFNITAFDGEKRRMNQRSAPIFSRENPDEVVEMVAVMRDITKQYHGHMELVEAKAEAEESYRVKSSFLATMSHEFRTPLNAILGFSEMLSAQYLGPLGADKYPEYAGDIHSSGAHLLELINDILDISAIEARRSPMDKTSFNMDELIDECITSVEPQAQSGEIELNKDIDASLDQVFAHRRGIKQIIINLLANGIKYNHAGGSVTISSHMSNDVLHISVADNGFGIEEDFLPRIMEPFSRAEEDAHMAQEGTGLGLSICQKLIEAYDGKIHIESTYGLGTTVFIEMPLAEEPKMRHAG